MLFGILFLLEILKMTLDTKTFLKTSTCSKLSMMLMCCEESCLLTFSPYPVLKNLLVVIYDIIPFSARRFTPNSLKYILKSAVPEYIANFSLRILAMYFSFFASTYGGLPMTISKPSFEGQQYVIDTMLLQIH